MAAVTCGIADPGYTGGSSGPPAVAAQNQQYIVLYEKNTNISGTKFQWAEVKDNDEKGLECKKKLSTHDGGGSLIPKAFEKIQTHSMDRLHTMDITSLSHSGVKQR
ncbi:hypothetical protein B0H17DRAFT_1138741 [Mycena rosella]|uniref:Uncharacterized protein n=1 Tax=Mycena rosella TaxID=1033263 RepID=A0AAD7D621_MYCRO|nr:hypothetical protein B0H17DRAFT_1138741 [Mycena rosella]